MTQWLSKVMLSLAVLAVLLWSGAHVAAQTTPGSAPEAKDMALVGYNDLQIPEFAKNQRGQTADFVVLVNESTQNECREHRQMVFLVDVTTPFTPQQLRKLVDLHAHIDVDLYLLE